MSEHGPILDARSSGRRERLWVALLLGLTLILRTVTVLFGPNHLNDDRDAYLAIAQGIAEGRGFSVPGSEMPTAYRPPLYPLLIAPVSGTGAAGQVGRGVFHVALAVVSVWLVWRAGSHLGLSLSGRFLAGGLIAVDPVLVLYANFPMTETVCTMLGTWLLERAVGSPFTSSHCSERGTASEGVIKESRSPDTNSFATHKDPHRWRSELLTGVVFGLCVLSRPTFLVTGALLAGVALVHLMLPCSAVANRPFVRLQRWAIVAAAAVGTLAPWVMRNWLVMGAPILTTTHGGYTLLLGNNETFYREVASDSWSTVWEGTSQQRWADQLNRRMDELGLSGEVERDRWLNRRAKETIAKHPGLFLKATLVRAVQFWQIYPGGESARQYPRWLLIAVAVLYVLVWACGVVGLSGIVVRRDLRWLPVVVIPLSFWLVHTVYWSNIRMRAPVMPAVVLVAAHGLCQLKKRITS